MNLRELRQERGLTQMALATMMGSRPQQISGWERGASCPSTKFILPLADALGVSVEQILEAVRTDQERT